MRRLKEWRINGSGTRLSVQTEKLNMADPAALPLINSFGGLSGFLKTRRN
jgi:hypothetical protein